MYQFHQREKMTHHRTVLLTIMFLAHAVMFAGQNRTTVIKQGHAGAKEIMNAGSELLHIPELSAMIAESQGLLTVDHILEASMRPKGYEKTDMKENDIIIMANGRKLNGLADLKNLYTSASRGSLVKLGIKRNEEMLIVSFSKADPNSMPHMRMMISRGGDEDFLGIPQVGLRFASNGTTVVVKEVLPNASTELPGVDVKEGDTITKLNGFPVKSFKAFEAGYTKLLPGDHVELISARAGKVQKIMFSKPKDDGKVIIRRQGRQ